MNVVISNRIDIYEEKLRVWYYHVHDTSFVPTLTRGLQVNVVYIHYHDNENSEKQIVRNNTVITRKEQKGEDILIRFSITSSQSNLYKYSLTIILN